MIQDAFQGQRERMVRAQLEPRAITDPRVLSAFLRVPRHRFVPDPLLANAYENRPLEIGHGQTISQPLMVATMLQALCIQPGDKVLEVGTGSGYQTALLVEMGARVYTMERIADLSFAARRRLEELGFMQISFCVGDGSLGWPEEAPFDRILVAAAAPSLPVRLPQQLAEGGSLVIPVGDDVKQTLILLKRSGGFIKRTKVCDCVFVKLIGEEGWDP